MSNLTINTKSNITGADSLKNTLSKIKISKIRQTWDESANEALSNAKKYKIENLDQMFLDLRKNV